MKKTRAINFKQILLLFTLIFSQLFFSCKTVSSVVQKEPFEKNILYPQEINWELLQEGVEYTSYNIDSLKIKWHCIKLDLDLPELKIDCAPNSTKIKNFHLKNFANKHNALIAINSTPFAIKSTYEPVGITKIDNKVIYPCKENYCALGFYTNSDGKLRAKIIDKQIPEEIEKCIHAFGGFFTTMRDKELKSFEKIRRSRNACGLDEDGRFLYLFITVPNFSFDDRNGLDYMECSEILKHLGCDDAMQFDGGHSTGMIYNGKHVDKPTLQRKVPTAIAFCIE